MCGLVGFWDKNGASRAVVADMAEKLRHRGPDDSGEWISDEGNLALGHRRLSILDLTSAGHQPMHSHSGRYVVVMNGEIYNHRSLRDRMKRDGVSIAWRGHSDTETLLEAFANWGIKSTLEASVGMFALAVWDRQQKTLTLARDRLGEKPLYVGFQQGALLFGSELKALQAHPKFRRDIDRDSLALLLRHNCIPAPYSIFKGIQKLRPGHFMAIPLGADVDFSLPNSEPYWQFNDVIECGRLHPFEGSDADAVDAVHARLLDSVGLQMLSDVPLGAFLSGGIDSSLIVALMQANSSQPIRTFTIGFDNDNYDEAVHAKAVASYLGTDHTELYVSAEDARAIIPKLPTIYCEPFSDSSQIPTYLVSALASQHVKVALSGDGGDELFGGYNRYLTAQSIWTRMNQLPRAIRSVSAKLLMSVSPAGLDRFFRAFSKYLPDRYQARMPGEKIHKLAGVLMHEDIASFHRQLTSHWPDPTGIVFGAKEPPTLLTQETDWPKTENVIDWMMAIDAQSYLPDDILVKVDRAAMANSLETRVPFLDHRVVELAWRIPRSTKIRGGTGKWLLRQVLGKYVPNSYFERPKAGFTIPLGEWLRGPLREWAEVLLDASRLRREEFFDPKQIRLAWDAHISGKTNEQHVIWDVLMFQAWLAEQ